MRPHILALALAVIPALPLAAPAQTSVAPAGAPRPAATLPDSPLGRLAQRFLDVVDAGDSATVTAFVSEHLGRDVRGRSSAQMAGMIRKLHAQSGGLRVERAMMAGSAVRMFTRAKSAEKMLGIELEPVVGDSTRIAGVTIAQMDEASMSGPPKPWAEGALDDQRIADVIRAKVKEAADADRFSGAVLVARGDRVLVLDNHGFADAAAKRPITPSTPFATYSMGKMFTSVAIAQLVASGKLGWDDTLAKVLPSYPNGEAAQKVTIRQLLTHTAGIPDVFLSKRFSTSKRYASHGAMLPDFADAPLNPNHGKSFDYSNGNFVVLAAVVERLSGLSYDEYLARNIFTPAGMTLPKEKSAIGYARFTELDPLGVEPRRPETVRGAGKSATPSVAYGFGGGAYTAQDLYRFARALRTGKLVPQAIADSIVKGEVTMGGRTKYALGFFDRAMNGKRVVGHSGSNPDTGHDADLQIAWDDEWTVVVLSNYDAPAGMMLSMPILELIPRSSTTGAGDVKR